MKHEDLIQLLEEFLANGEGNPRSRDLIGRSLAVMVEQQEGINRIREERNLAQQLLLERGDRHDPRACTDRGWQ